MAAQGSERQAAGRQVRVVLKGVGMGRGGMAVRKGSAWRNAGKLQLRLSLGEIMQMSPLNEANRLLGRLESIGWGMGGRK